MDNHNNDFSLAAIGEALMDKQIVDTILSCNETTKIYGLVLSEEQALALADTRSSKLKETGRIEFGKGIIDKLISAFYNSPYISQQNYEDTLHELINLFYDFKNDTWEVISDNELIEFMKDAFNGSCHGSLELLSGNALTSLSRHIHNEKFFDSYRLPMEKKYE